MKTTLCIAILLAASVICGQNLIVNGNFAKADANGKPEGWTAGSGEVVEEGPKGANALRITAIHQIPSGGFKGTIHSKVPSLKPGKYTLSGKIKGNTYALWIVLGFKNDLSGEKFTKWLEIPREIKKLENDWMQFELPLEAPENTVEGFLVIESFHTAKDQFTYLTDVALAPVK